MKNEREERHSLIGKRLELRRGNAGNLHPAVNSLHLNAELDDFLCGYQADEKLIPMDSTSAKENWVEF